jgi:hypothetical protein
MGMRIVLFDAILEQHVCRSLLRALEARGHQVSWTGQIWHGHRFPSEARDIALVEARLDEVCAQKPDCVVCLRASTLRPEQVRRLGATGARRLVWLPDDPVLYQVCYREVVDAYDVLLHCGGAQLLSFYRDKGHPPGVNFPFWTDNQETPRCRERAEPEWDVVFLGQCKGPVRGDRYGLLGSLPFVTRVVGRVASDPQRLCVGHFTDQATVAAQLARARCGLSLPQVFAKYAGHEYDFPELAQFGHFEYPSRVIQYAATGLPVLSLQPGGPPSTFPELLTCADRREVIDAVSRLVRDEPYRDELSNRVHRRFRRSFSAAARAVFLSRLLEDPGRYLAGDAEQRTVAFARFGDEVEAQDAV